MLQTAEEIIKYIGDAKKQTPIKIYLIQMHSIYLEIVILKLLLEI